MHMSHNNDRTHCQHLDPGIKAPLSVAHSTTIAFDLYISNGTRIRPDITAGRQMAHNLNLPPGPPLVQRPATVPSLLPPFWCLSDIEPPEVSGFLSARTPQEHSHNQHPLPQPSRPGSSSSGSNAANSKHHIWRRSVDVLDKNRLRACSSMHVSTPRQHFQLDSPRGLGIASPSSRPATTVGCSRTPSSRGADNGLEVSNLTARPHTTGSCQPLRRAWAIQQQPLHGALQQGQQEQLPPQQHTKTPNHSQQTVQSQQPLLSPRQQRDTHWLAAYRRRAYEREPPSSYHSKPLDFYPQRQEQQRQHQQHYQRQQQQHHQQHAAPRSAWHQQGVVSVQGQQPHGTLPHEELMTQLDQAIARRSRLTVAIPVLQSHGSEISLAGFPS